MKKKQEKKLQIKKTTCEDLDDKTLKNVKAGRSVKTAAAGGNVALF